ncbi:MAG: hypothetical protein ACREL6_11885 [Gemmatimonadales bacterium]
MFIELTDHLRCPADHEEQFLVLVPDVMEQRSVRSGRLGCPVCRLEFLIREGVADLRLPDAVAASAEGTAPSPPGTPPPDGAGILALLGLSGPGGYVLLSGNAGAAAPELIVEEPGVHVVVLNPQKPLPDIAMLSVLRADRIPFKRRSLRGVMLGSGQGGDERWIGEAVRTVLPGLRIAGAGAAPADDALTILAVAGGWWVAILNR